MLNYNRRVEPARVPNLVAMESPAKLPSDQTEAAQRRLVTPLWASVHHRLSAPKLSVGSIFAWADASQPHGRMADGREGKAFRDLAVKC